MKNPALDASKKERLIAEVRRVAAANGGQAPGLRLFAQQVREKHHVWAGTLWAYNQFLEEAGLQPNELTTPIPGDALLAHVASVIRRLGKMPSAQEIRFAKTSDPSFPTDTTIFRRFGSIAKLVEALKVWADQSPERGDVAQALSLWRARRGTPAPLVEASPNEVASLRESFLPPVLECLPALAEGNELLEQECRARGLSSNVELERRIAVAFRILGFDVEELGQGQGRVADGIARHRPGRWAVVYDAKLRRGGFSLGTEDRKFKEYIEKYAQSLHHEGVSKLYFAVVSSSFAASDEARALEVARLTAAKACVLLEARALVTLVEHKISDPLQASWDRVERLFASSRIVGPNEVKGALR